MGGDLSAGRRYLQDASASLTTKEWKRGANHADGAKEIGLDLMLNLLVSDFLGDPYESEARVADTDIDASELLKYFFYRTAAARVGQFELREQKLVAILCLQLLAALRLARGASHPIPALQKLLTERTAASHSFSALMTLLFVGFRKRQCDPVGRNAPHRQRPLLRKSPGSLCRR